MQRLALQYLAVPPPLQSLPLIFGDHSTYQHPRYTHTTQAKLIRAVCTSSLCSAASGFIVRSFTTFWAPDLGFCGGLAPGAGTRPKPAADRPASVKAPPPLLLGGGSLAN